MPNCPINPDIECSYAQQNAEFQRQLRISAYKNTKIYVYQYGNCPAMPAYCKHLADQKHENSFAFFALLREKLAQRKKENAR